MKRIFIAASKVFPRSYKESMDRALTYAGIETTADVWLGESLILGIFVFIAVSQFSRFGDPLLFYPLAFLAFIIYLMGSYSIPYFQSKNRAESVEQVLPSALQLMAANIRAGMTPFQAIKVSARDEFGILKEELDRATTRALGTGSFSDALLDISNSIASVPLDRALKLFIRSVESGGQSARVLEETARDISQNMALKKELVTSTKTYSLLVLFSVLIGTPLLLTISIHFTERIGQMRSSLEVAEIEGLEMGLLVGEMVFTSTFLVSVSAFIIIATSFIASLLMGVIREGEEKYGLKYALFIVPISLILFYTMRHITTMFLQ